MQKECPQSADRGIGVKYAGDSGPASEDSDPHLNQPRLHGAVQACFLEGVRKCCAHIRPRGNVSSEYIDFGQSG